MTMMKLLHIAAVVFLISGSYGCSGLGKPGTGSGFQGGTEAGNPPTDGGLFGGTEAGNPPTGETTGGPNTGHEDPREGGGYCDLPDTPEKEGEFPCPTLGEGHKVEQLTPEQIGILHEKQEEQEESSQNGSTFKFNTDTAQKVNGALGDFGQAEAAGDKTINLPPPSSATTIHKNLK